MQVLNRPYQPKVKNQILQNNYLQKNDFANKNNKQQEVDLNKSPLALYNVSFTGVKAINKIPTKLERFEGCLLGGAIGDAFGAPVEFKTLEQIKKRYGKNGLCYIPKQNNTHEVTDDTQMTLFTAEGLLKSYLKTKNITSEPDYNSIYESYQNWYKTQTIPFEEQEQKSGLMELKSLYQRKLPGKTCLKSLSYHIPGNVDIKLNNSAGNGGAMRVSPIGLLYHENPELAFVTGMKTASLTHSNPRAYLSAGYLSSLISHLVNGDSLDEAIIKSEKILKKYDKENLVLKKLQQGINYARENYTTDFAIEEIGLGFTGDEAVSIALFSILKNPNSIKDALICAINHSGDSDTTGAITGNIIGAMLGIKEFPRNWRENVEFSNVLSNYAKILNSISNKPIKKETNGESLLTQWQNDKLS